MDGGASVALPPVNTLNVLTSGHAARLTAVQGRLPPTIAMLLFLATVVSMVIMGAQQGAAVEWHPGPAAGFTALVCLSAWVILDRNQPQRGAIPVSQKPMRRVLSGMGR